MILHSIMLKNNSKKTLVSAGCAAVLLLLLLLAALQHLRVQVSQHTNGQVNPPGSDPDPDRKGFSAYFTKLTRGRRELETPARTSSSKDSAAEDISAEDIFIAVKTTKKFHQSRLNLLLETWVSRNMKQVILHLC